MGLKIEPLSKGKHLRSDFSCGKESLDRYLHQQASQDFKRRVAAVFVLIDEPNVEVLGYYTLSSFSIDISALQEDTAKRLPRYPTLPATLLGRLAVSRTQQGRGLGEILLIDALSRSFEAAQQVASLAVVAEALDETAVDFYIKYGFQPFSNEPMKLYVPMRTVEQLCKTFSL